MERVKSKYEKLLSCKQCQSIKPVMKIKFLYIEYGHQKTYVDELTYSLATLLDHHSLVKSDVLVYTENTETYAHLPVTAVSIAKDITAYSLNGAYHFRVKPCVIKRALQEHGQDANIVFLDTDTYFKKNISRYLAHIDTQHVLMNKFEKRNPYPGEVLTSVQLPSGKTYSYDEQYSIMYNSGLVGLHASHTACLDDAIAIIDAMVNASFKAHTIEQCAVAEAFRIHQVHISEVYREVKHYWPSTDKKYMRRQLASLAESGVQPNGLPVGRIKHSWLRARLHKLPGFGT
jgi:hypothetical protein